jgi:hypothetical protein
MKKTLLIGIAASLLATGTAHAAEKRLPKEFWGKWCAENPVTGGGGPGLWEYSHNQCNDSERAYGDQDITLGPNIIGKCKFTKITRDHDKVYHITIHCKDGDGKLEMWLDEETLGFRDIDNPPYQAHPYEQ